MKKQYCRKERAAQQQHVKIEEQHAKIEELAALLADARAKQAEAIAAKVEPPAVGSEMCIRDRLKASFVAVRYTEHLARASTTAKP